MPGKKKISTHHLIIKDQLANFPALNNFVFYQEEKDKGLRMAFTGLF